MDILTKALNLMEKVDLDAEGDLERLGDDEDNEKRFQHENPYNQHLPYDVTEESQRHLTRIKVSIANCIQLDQETAYEWFIELENFINLYGLAFTKEDHIYFVKLQYELMVSDSSMDLVYLVHVARCFTKMMRKRFLISPDELQFDWRRFYESYERLLYSETESLGLRFVPESLEANLSQAIILARPHFSINATREMLEEWRPKLCPFSVSIQRAVTYLNLFLPTTLPPEHHDKGFKLWFDEVMQLWLSGKISVAIYESKFTLLLSRLASDCLGYINWEPYLTRIFNQFKFGLNLNGTGTRNNVRRANDSIDVGPCVQWMVYMISEQNSCLDYITKLFKAIESFYHPSNTDRRWHKKLQQFLYKFPACYVKRLYRERHKKNIWSKRVPESHKLTDELTSKFVDALLPVVLTSMFNQAGISSAALALRDLAFLCPEKVIPPLLERLYGSYESVTEPQRLLASIDCMSSVVPAMVRPHKLFPEGPTHVIPLLINSLPGIDSNDMRKCITVFRFIATVAAHITMKDYSYLVDEIPDLEPSKQELCLSTRHFEDFVLQFLDKSFILIEDISSLLTYSSLDHDTQLKSGEEGIIEAAISSVTLSILAQASPGIQHAALDRLYSYVTRNVFDIKTRGKAIATLCLACAKACPKETLAKFVPHYGRLILTLTENEEVQKESILDDDLLFGLLLISEMVRCNSSYLLDHKDIFVRILDRALGLTSKEGYLLACAILRHLLRALTNIACSDWRNVDLDDEANNSIESKWPFDNWGHTTNLKELKIKWQIPGPESRQFAQELMEIFLKKAMSDLLAWSNGLKTLSRDERQRSLHVVLSTLVGSASVLPEIQSPVMELCKLEVPIVSLCVSYTGTEPLNFKDGTNVRTWIVENLKTVLAHVNSKNEDDFKSLVIICEIFSTAVSYFGLNKTELRHAAQRIKSMKSSSINKLLGQKRHLRYLLVERVAQQHRAMLLNKGVPEFTELHMDIFKLLFNLAQSHYLEARLLSQDTVFSMLGNYPHLESKLVPMMVEELRKPEIEHKKFKGLLYLIVSRRTINSIAIDPNWSLLKQLWPAIVESPHSEKPSIVRLMDAICGLVQGGFNTFELEYSHPPSVKEIAKQVWTNGLVDLETNQPPSDDFIMHTKKKVVERNRIRLNDYKELVQKLVDSIEDPHLHWHRRIVAYYLFSQLMRDDHPLPVSALNLCLDSLISDRIAIRTYAVQLVSAQLKLHKREHKKRTIKFQLERKPCDQITIDTLKDKAEKISLDDSEQENGEEDPMIITSNSNKWMQYKLSDGNYTKEEWNKLIFVDKPHIGFYEWPKELSVYQPYEMQPQLNRNPDELNQHELIIFRKFNDESFVEKLVNYFCFEVNKANPETHRFDTKRPTLFKGLFRNYGPCMIEPFRKYVVEYATSTCEHKQKFTIEFIAGLLRGSKHWSYEMLADLKTFTLFILEKMTITKENLNDWTGMTNYIFRHRDVKRFEWLLKYFVMKAICPTNTLSPTTKPIIQANRLTLAHYALIQCEWRAVDHIFPKVVNNLMKQDHLLAYANIRTCLASIYSLIYMYDDPTALTNIPGTLTGGPKRKDFIEFLIPKFAILGKSKQSHISITSDDDSATKLEHDQSVRKEYHDDKISGIELNSPVDDKTIFLSEMRNPAGPSSAIATRLPMDATSNNESDMVLIAETIERFRHIGTNPGSPSTPRESCNYQLRDDIVDVEMADESKVDKKNSIRDVEPAASTEQPFGERIRSNSPSIESQTPVNSYGGGSASDDSDERKDAIKLMKLTSCWIIYNIFRMKSPVPADFFKLLPIICEMGRDNSDPELTADSLAAVAVLGGSILSYDAIDESLKCVRKIMTNHSWHARVAAAAFIEMIISSNLFNLLGNERWRNDLEDIVMNHLICDERIEVRESSSLTLSGMIHCQFTQLTSKLLDEFKNRANQPIIKRKHANGTTVIDPKCIITKHSGILCLCACVDAHPYTVPDYLPEILTFLSDHLTDPQPISTTIKKTLSNFRRTHYDNWQSDKKKFTDDQLCVLSNLLVGPNYYA